jgi:hypothetical protein
MLHVRAQLMVDLRDSNFTTRVTVSKNNSFRWSLFLAALIFFYYIEVKDLIRDFKGNTKMINAFFLFGIQLGTLRSGGWGFCVL